MIDQSWGYQVGDTVQLATLTRAGLVESRHHGLAVLVDTDGKVVEAHGHYKKLIYPRSALKPLQAVAVRRSGLILAGAELAISAGSHQGTAAHRDLVLSILQSVGLSETDLLCPLAWPGNPTSRSEVREQSKSAFNCSGKHAGFLAACVKNDWDTKSYLDLVHPLQQMIVEVTEEFAGEKIHHSTVDGCGAPLHALSLQGLARSIGRFAATEKDIASAMKANAWAVGDKGQWDSVILEHGMVSKIGAEGVFVIGLDSGHGVAVKIADGSMRAAGLVALKLLLNQSLIDSNLFKELYAALNVPSLGGSEVLGGIELTV
ncbi:MAG: asparaginase [Actinomycetota bacterium]